MTVFAELWKMWSSQCSLFQNLILKYFSFVTNNCCGMKTWKDTLWNRWASFLLNVLLHSGELQSDFPSSPALLLHPPTHKMVSAGSKNTQKNGELFRLWNRKCQTLLVSFCGVSDFLSGCWFAQNPRSGLEGISKLIPFLLIINLSFTSISLKPFMPTVWVFAYFLNCVSLRSLLFGKLKFISGSKSLMLGRGLDCFQITKKKPQKNSNNKKPQKIQPILKCIFVREKVNLWCS